MLKQIRDPFVILYGLGSAVLLVAAAIAAWQGGDLQIAFVALVSAVVLLFLAIGMQLALARIMKRIG
jgi:hypothetical protein